MKVLVKMQERKRKERKPVFPFKLGQKILPLRNETFFPIVKFSHITYVNKLKEVRALPLPYLIFLGQKDGTGGPVSSSNYCPINGRFTISLTREDQVSRVGRT